MVGVRFLPALMVVALVCVVAALGLLAFAGRDTGGGDQSVREMNELLALSQKLPLQANAALSGTQRRVQRAVGIAHPLCLTLAAYARS